MAITTENINGRMVCKFSGALNIWEVADTWQSIYPLLSSKDSLVIDFSGVNECDVAGLQIICQIRQVASQENQRITISELSESVQTAIQQAGMDPEKFIQPLEGR